MKKASLSLISIITLYHIAIGGNTDTALNTKVSQWMKNSSGIRFIENKGQMANEKGNAINSLLFKTNSNGVDMYITTSGLSYIFINAEQHKKIGKAAFANKFHGDDDSITDEYCRADMELIGADIRKENIVKEGESEDRADYYLGGICPNGVMNVHSYSKITIKNIYPGIDWVMHSGQQGLKYDFIVHPDADPSLIKLKYKWTDKPELQSDGSLKINTPMSSITEGVPLSYTRDSRNKVQTNYTLENEEIRFTIGRYNTNETLVLDPPLVWATYYAGTQAAQDVYSMQDDGNNVWVTGWTNSVNFPTVNPGGSTYFQGSLSGTENVFILQFTTSGILNWATCYGGSTYDFGASIYSDGTNVWVTGYSQSTNFPTQNPGGGAYFQSASGGGQNAFILQFSTTGIRQWATYYGGNGTDFSNSIQSDGTNVWVTGATSSTNFPTLNSGGHSFFQGTLGGTNIQSPFILQFNTAGVLKWATYYGVSGSGQSIQSDGTNVWVTGQPGSSLFPTLNPGGGAYFQSLLAGAFIAEFSMADTLKWATYFGGGGEVGNSIQSDGKNVWLTGQTQSASFPTLNPGGSTYFQGGISSRENAFIAKFNTSGVLKWSTYYGGSGCSVCNFNNYGEYGTSIQSDGTNVWVTGVTTSIDLPTLNPGGSSFFQGTITNGNEDVFILQFDTMGVRKWATYYGNNYENEWSSVSCDGTVVFLSDDAFRSGTYPQVNPGGGAYFYNTIAGGENVFVAKFCSICNCKVTSVNITSSKTSICIGDSLTLSAFPVGNDTVKYKWAPDGQTTASIHVTPAISTTYTVTVTDTVGCSHKNMLLVAVNPKPVPTISGTQTICRGDSVTLSASVAGGNTATYNWLPSGQTTSSINVKPPINSTYSVTANISGCIGMDSVTITVNPLPKVLISPVGRICSGNSIILTATGAGTYNWNPSSGLDSTNIASPMASPTINTTYTVTGTTSGCNGIDSVTVNVNPIPVPNVCCDSNITIGEKVQLIVSGGKSYLWSPSTYLNCNICSNPLATPTQTTTYTVKVTSDSGCSVKDSVTIVVNNDVDCNVFIPNAFSPNETYNNILYVRGSCIATMDFIVYDRWGNKIFENEKQNEGWDGTFKGQPMNMATYVWYLKATLLDGTSIEKKGNVTLVR